MNPKSNPVFFWMGLLGMSQEVSKRLVSWVITPIYIYLLTSYDHFHGHPSWNPKNPIQLGVCVWILIGLSLSNPLIVFVGVKTEVYDPRFRAAH